MYSKIDYNYHVYLWHKWIIARMYEDDTLIVLVA